MKNIIFAGSLLFLTLQTQAQKLEMRLSSEKRSIFRFAPFGAAAGTAGYIIGNAVASKPGGIAGGALFSIASSLLVRSRTDAHTSLITAGTGFLCTAGLTIGLNGRKNSKKRNSVDCFKF